MNLHDRLKLMFVEHRLVPHSLLRRRQEQEFSAWQQGQTSRLPHLLKQRIVLEEARLAGTRIFVETGTYYGLMLQACLEHFDALYSIEIEPHFYRRACKIFSGDQKVTLLYGDSAELLPKLLATIESPCLFWLDAHYSGGLTGRGKVETPIYSELNAIFEHRCKHVVIIDDLDCFDGTNGYPPIEQVAETVTERGYVFSKEHSIARIRPV